MGDTNIGGNLRFKACSITAAKFDFIENLRTTTSGLVAIFSLGRNNQLRKRVKM